MTFLNCLHVYNEFIIIFAPKPFNMTLQKWIKDRAIHGFPTFSIEDVRETEMYSSVENSWSTGEAELTTYHFEELLGTKLRALYQRKKGRDLFDLYIALQRKEVDVDKVLQCYKKYMKFVVDKAPSYKQFVNNMQEKMEDPEFTNDIQSLLRPGISFNASDAYPLIYETFIDKMEGKRD